MSLKKKIKGGRFTNNVLNSEDSIYINNLATYLIPLINDYEKYLELPEDTTSESLTKTYILTNFAAQCDTAIQCIENIIDFPNNMKDGYYNGVTKFVSSSRENYNSVHLRYWNIIFIIKNNIEGIPENKIPNIIKKTIKNIESDNYNYLPQPILLNEQLIKKILIPYVETIKSLERSRNLTREVEERLDENLVMECFNYFKRNFDSIKKYSEWWLDVSSSYKFNETNISKIKQTSGNYVIDSYIENLTKNTLSKSLNLDRLLLKVLEEKVMITGGGLFDYFTSRQQKPPSPSISELTRKEARQILKKSDYDIDNEFTKSFQQRLDEMREFTPAEKEEKTKKLIKNMRLILLSYYKHRDDDSTSKFINSKRLTTTRIGGKKYNKKTKKRSR